MSKWIRALAASAVGVAVLSAAGLAQAQPTAPDVADAAALLDIDQAGNSSSLRIESAPVLTDGVVKRNEPLLSFNVRHTRAGRLAEPLVSRTVQLEAGTLLFGAAFGKQRGASDALPAWCGAGQRRLWGGSTTVCIVGSPDGSARVVDGVTALVDPKNGSVSPVTVRAAPSWYVSAVRSVNAPEIVARPRITAAESSELPLLQVSLRAIGKFRGGLGVVADIGLAGDLNSRREMRVFIAPLNGSTGRLAFGRFDLVVDLLDGGAKAHWEPANRGERNAQAGQAQAPDAEAPALSGRPRPTPFVIGGMQVAVDQLTAASGLVQSGGLLLSGPARHWRTARAEGLAHSLVLKMRTAPGAVFQAVETVTVNSLGGRSIERAWCGPFSLSSLPSQTWCATERDGGKFVPALTPSGGREWLLTTSGSVMREGQAATLDALQLTASPDDLMGPLLFQLRLDGAGRELALRAEARRGEEVVTLWRGSVLFEGGVARAPLWSHQLVATKVGNAVTVRLEPSGDGSGLLEITAPQKR